MTRADATATLPPARRAGWLLPGATLALAALTLAPTLLVAIPAMVDYPNHLARMSILARAGTPEANPFYEVAWGFYPNLGMDLVVPGLARLIGVLAAMKAFLLVSQLLLVTGAIAIEWAVKRRFEAAGIAALLYLHSWPFAFGFLNFAFALGIALWGIAAWIALSRRPATLRIAAHCAFVLALFVGHLFALGLYGAAIGLIELRKTALRKTALRKTAARKAIDAPALAFYAMMAAPAAALALAMAASGGAVGGLGTAWAFGMKPLLLASINGYDAFASFASTAIIALGLYVLARRGWLRLEPGGGWLAAGFFALFLAMPLRLFDTAFVDVRVAAAAAFILPGFASARIPPGLPLRITRFAIAAIALVNLSAVAATQAAYEAEYGRIIASFAHLAPGARILVAHSGNGAEPPIDLAEYPIFHAPVLAAHYANAFVPTLFAYPGKQPVLARADLRRIAPFDGALETLDRLARIARAEMRAAPEAVADWARDFDYLYVVGPEVANPLPDRLIPFAEGTRFRAYRIVRGGAPPGSVNER